MLGERSDQRSLWEADRLYLDHVGKDTFYGLLASLRGQLFRDADFAGFYCPDNGRDSVPPSLLATALLLQTHDKVSDAEAKARADFDIRWVEHRLARLVQLGIRQARYFGRTKTRFQLYLAATVANLTLVAGKADLTGETGSVAIGDHAACADTGSYAVILGAVRLAQIWPLALLTPVFLPEALFSTKAFHPHF